MITCTNPFIEEDGYCAKCGQIHLIASKKNTSTRKQVAAVQLLQSEKSQRIAVGIENNPAYRTIKAQIIQLCEIYEIKVNVVFRNTKQSYFTEKYITPTIVIGYESADRSYTKGFSEYACCQHLLGYKKLGGTVGCQYLAMHEFAHAVFASKYPGSSEAPHGAGFRKIYKEIIDLVM